ncbi:hypothetical protein SAMN05444955_11932 [Lihuaxuella thermophila]|uniref:Uncharacterized protein n=1 Tax=Lihuaxuella thermophila TaxID=1173111 RepID=A0A1H8ISS9_9BACL|nr:hypothetical protein SAMN05444955_11932 [Lihuaxuella thermophila]
MRWIGKYFYFILLALLAVLFFVVIGSRFLSFTDGDEYGRLTFR